MYRVYTHLSTTYLISKCGGGGGGFTHSNIIPISISFKAFFLSHLLYLSVLRILSLVCFSCCCFNTAESQCGKANNKFEACEFKFITFHSAHILSSSEHMFLCAQKMEHCERVLRVCAGILLPYFGYLYMYHRQLSILVLIKPFVILLDHHGKCVYLCAICTHARTHTSTHARTQARTRNTFDPKLSC